jgi:serine/threonine protein kinase
MIKCFYCGSENKPDAKFCHNCGNNLQNIVQGNKPDADVELLSSHLSPKFSIEKRIGKGGMATVYLGEQTALQRKVVVKILNKDISDDDEIRERFLLEARMPAKIRHPNIVEVLDVGIVDNRPYYIMEYASGGSVADKLKKYRDAGTLFPIREATDLITKILDALHFCHMNNLQSHRDIKPANIMYRANGEPIIVDFGIAKISESSITRTKMTMGTANYMSPEQCQGRKDIDGRSDVYSVGIMLFEILTGELPFKGDSGLSIMVKQVKEKLPSLTTKLKARPERPDPDFSLLSGGIEEIIEKACAKNKTKRYQTAKEFAEALANLAGSELPITLRQTPIQKGINVGLIFAMLLLGLGIGGLIGFKLITSPKTETIAPNIRIETVPTGAKIVNSNNNVDEGITPFETLKTESGAYRYKLILEGYKEQEIEIDLKDLNKKSISKIDLILNEIPPEEVKTIVKDEKAYKDTGLVSLGGLIWQTTDIKFLTWYGAFSHCKNLGMRLPTKNEFRIAYGSGIKKLVAPCCEYWTANVHEDDPDSAYNVSMKGFDNFYSPKGNRFYVRCVAKQ